MEIFTELEFNQNELLLENDVTTLLESEGWEEINRDENTVIRSGVKIVKSIKYKWVRYI